MTTQPNRSTNPMTRIRYALLAIALTLGGATIGASCTLPSGCTLIVPAGYPIPGDWIYDGATGSWWDPEDGFIGWATTEDGNIWQPTHRCAETNGLER